MRLIQLATRKYPQNKTGVNGVCYHKATKKYCAQIQCIENGKPSSKWLGVFATIAEAAAAIEPYRTAPGNIQYAMVSDEDYDFLSQYSWHFSDEYVVRYIYPGGKRTKRRMHHDVASRMGMEYGPQKNIDHIDHDGKNNQRTNLREADDSQNCCNSRTYKNNTSGIKGVSFDIGCQKWVAQVQCRGKIWKKRFSTIAEAAAAREAMAREMHGEFAFPGHGFING